MPRKRHPQYDHKPTGHLDFDALSPEALAELVEFSVLNQPPITPGQVVGAEMYARQIDVDATQQVVESSVAETSIYNYTLGGGTLGTQGGVRLLLLCTYLNSSGSSSTLELKVSYGATLMYEDAITNSSQTLRTPLLIDLYLTAADSTSSQRMHGNVFLGDRATAVTTGLGAFTTPAGGGASVLSPIYGTASENSALNKAIDVTVQHSVNSASTSLHKNYALLTKIGH